jgi:hypothetical protein
MPKWPARWTANFLLGYASPLSQAASRYRQWRQVPAADLASNHGTAAASRKPAPPERNGPAMNGPDSTEHRVQRAEELVCWTGRERLRFLWYRLRLTISDMNYAQRRIFELQTRLPTEWPTPPPSASKKALPVASAGL